MAKWGWAGVVAMVGCLLSACSSSSSAPPGDCPVGSERCACTSGGACNPGLQCLSQLCVSEGDAAGGSSSSGSSGSSSGGSSGATFDATTTESGAGDATVTDTGSPPDGTATDAGGDGGPGASPCDGGRHTTISGRVYDPANLNPLYGVVVYVPGATPAPLPGAGINPCGSCAAFYTASLASAVTDANGGFTIVDAPAGTNVPLVVQQGKWRMQYTLPTVTACQANAQSDHTLRLPKNHTEGDIPQIAVSTGSGDSLECVLRRMGIDASEYVAGPGTASGGHIHIFTGSGGVGGAAISGGTAYDPAGTLWDKPADLQPYDVVLFSCEGGPTAKLTSPGQQAILDYARAGGRVFASHYHYAILDTGPFAVVTPTIATWDVSALNADNDPTYGKIVQTVPDGGSFPEGVALGAWLGNLGATADGGELPVHYARDNTEVDASANPGTQPWLVGDQASVSPGKYTQYFSYDFASGQGPNCGRVVYSDIHASGGPNNASDPNTDYPGFNPGIVPDGCASHALTPQEKALEFMIFDLSSCLVPPGQVPQGP
jgi:hypothetical protein